MAIDPISVAAPFYPVTLLVLNPAVAILLLVLNAAALEQRTLNQRRLFVMPANAGIQ